LIRPADSTTIACAWAAAPPSSTGSSNSSGRASSQAPAPLLRKYSSATEP
jgi:hypothetical protein